MMLSLHVNEHDKAYRWARGRTVSVDPVTSRVRIIESVEGGAATPTVIPPAPTPPASTTELPAYEPRAASFLFEDVSDQVLLDVGVGTGELGRVRALRTEADLLKQEEQFDATSYDILVCLQGGFDPETVREMISGAQEGEKEGKLDLSVAEAIRAEEGRATIFMPKDETELRRVLEGDLAGWRVFLHPDQRRFAYRSYNGPVLIRGGVGTGKTVVAMHRARHLADEIAQDPARAGEKVLVTTFTTNLARDIEANLRTLCPEHMSGRNARIEVQNLDAWVGEFLRRRNLDCRIVYFSDYKTVQDIWSDVLGEADIPEDLTPEFVRNEWSQVIQAQGIESREAYFKTSRAGRRTALDRRKRVALWPIFEQFRSRLREEGIAEHDDAYREAIALLGRDGNTLPYAAVVVDEAQDTGEQAFRLIAAIAEGSSDKGNAIFIVGDAHQRIYDRKAFLSS